MKMRKWRKVIWWKMAPKVWDAYWQRLIDAALEDTPEEKKARRLRDEERWNTIWADIAKKQALRVLVEPEPEQEPVTLGTLLRDRFAKQDAERMAAGG